MQNRAFRLALLVLIAVVIPLTHDFGFAKGKKDKIKKCAPTFEDLNVDKVTGQSISEALKKYEFAYSSRDASKLTSIYPSFKEQVRLQATLDKMKFLSQTHYLENISISENGTEATVKTVQKATVQFGAGTKDSQFNKLDFHLTKVADGWIVSDVTLGKLPKGWEEPDVCNQELADNAKNNVEAPQSTTAPSAK